MEFSTCIDSLQEAILACRPRNIHTFAIRFFKDEKSPSPEEAHAVHMLPFLLYNEQRFMHTACIIYSFHMSADNGAKQYLEPSTVCGIVERMNLTSHGLRSKQVDEMAQSKIMSLKQVTFDLFLSCLRFPLNCYQLVMWLHCKLSQIEEQLSNTSIANVSLQRGQSTVSNATNKTNVAGTEPKPMVLPGSLQLTPPSTIELHKLKQFLQKESNSPRSTTTSSYNSSALVKVDRWHIRRSCAYHMHEWPAESILGSGGTGTSTSTAGTSPPHRGSGGGSGGSSGGSGETEGVPCGVSFADAEVRMLTRLLGNTVDALVDSGGPNVLSLETVVDAFMSRYLKLKAAP